VALLVLADDLAGLCIQRGEEAGGAVALVVVGTAFDLAWAHGQQRRRAIECLYLRFFLHAFFVPAPYG